MLSDLRGGGDRLFLSRRACSVICFSFFRQCSFKRFGGLAFFCFRIFFWRKQSGGFCRHFWQWHKNLNQKVRAKKIKSRYGITSMKLALPWAALFNINSGEFN